MKDVNSKEQLAPSSLAAGEFPACPAPDAEDIRLMEASGLFDEAWYRATYLMGRQEIMPPLVHFLRHGPRKGYWPNPYCEWPRFLALHPDAARSGLNPLLHYARGLDKRYYAPPSGMGPAMPAFASTPVTVLMAAYNAERFLDEAVKSILEQTFPDFTFLIVNDASSDGTAAMLDAWAARDARIRVVTNERNLGAAASRNRGLFQMHTPYTVVMDADDICAPDCVERKLRFMEANPATAALSSFLRPIDEHGTPQPHIWRPPCLPAEIRAALLEYGKGIPHPGSMFRTPLMRNAGGYRTFFEPAEDLDLFLRLAEHHDVACLAGQPAILYRQHPGGISANLDVTFAKGMLARICSERRLQGRPEPDMTAPPTLELMLSWLEEGSRSAWLWLSHLRDMSLPDNEPRLADALRRALPYPESMPPHFPLQEILRWCESQGADVGAARRAGK